MKLLLKKSIILITIFITCQVNSFSQIIPPYQNNFDTFDSTNWSHYAITGVDDWVMTSPAKTNFAAAYSFPNVWITKKTGSFNANSDRALQTPAFDLSDTSQNMVFTFYHQTYAQTGSTFIVEYSLNNGSTWSTLIDAASPSVQWQTSAGFPTNLYGSNLFRKSCIRIRFLQGNSNVRFRFRFNSTAATGEGWIIDNFRIGPEAFNVKAISGDTIRNLNRFFTQFNLKFNFQFDNQYTSTKTFTNNFYFSSDAIKDAGDLAIGTRTLNTNGTINNWTNTFNLPTGLHSGFYYVFYDLDATNGLTETDETDNLNYTVLQLDSVYNTSYKESFDSAATKWNGLYVASGARWTQGPPDYFRMERAHSWPNTFSTKTNSGTATMESPYLDLSHQTNQSICFWYKTTYDATTSNIRLNLPSPKSFKITPPVYSTNVNVRAAKNNDWDCFCYKLAAQYDTVVSTKIAIIGLNINPSAASTNPGGYNNYQRIAIDDIYIGESKPDASMEVKEGIHFTSTGLSTDTLSYYLYNSGLAQLPPSVTELYWSADSLLDSSDILLTSISEPALADTNFIKRKVSYTKPALSNGNYFIIYKLDATQSINEMREYNNTGYIKVIQYTPETLPYYNEFDTHSDNWHHYATLGNDDWECASPAKPNIPAAFSGTKAWITKAGVNTSTYSKMHLCSPVFDLTQLTHPVLEFDMKLITYGVNGYNYWPFNSINMSYSLDGGLTWTVLDTTNASFARWYHGMILETLPGFERIPANGSGTEYSSVIGNKREPVFQNYFRYQTRDGLNTTHFAIDLNFMKSNKKVLFRFNYVNVDAPMEGAMIDNFRISEATIDMAVNRKKNILAGTTDKYIATFFDVNNNGNYISPATTIKLFLSVDTILDASDALFTTRTIDKIRPGMVFYFNTKGNTNLLNTGVRYLIYQLDPQNTIPESNETNNVGYFQLCNQAPVSLPYFNDFNADVIDGWTTYNDSSGYNRFHRFRHHTVIQEYAYNAVDGEWFLDPIDYVNYNNFKNSYPINYLESPAFDFSDTIQKYLLEFDFTCVGNSYGTAQGGNLQYSKDGGATWTVLPAGYSNSVTIPVLNNQPGWAGYVDSHASLILNSLSGMGPVKFRFAYKGGHQYTMPGEQGFRMDNFRLSAIPGPTTTPTGTATPTGTNTATGVEDISITSPTLKYSDNNQFEISFFEDCSTTRIQIYDMTGKSVLDNHAWICNGKTKILIDLSQVKPGIYLINSIKDNTVKNYKVVVN